jgi:Carboxypeptidase regulatory-like domain/TonB-dependent Receptor Plug Domain
MSRIVRWMVVVALVSIPARPARAQIQTGSILVRATDDQGAVVPGATITISSSVVVSGSMTGLTDAAGVYRFPSLVPGTYTVKIELSGFQTIVREGIAVLVGQTTPIDAVLKVAAVAESITVAGVSPTVDTTSANVNVNLSEQLIQGTPGGRDIWALVEAKVPGLVMSRPDVGGTQGGLQGVYSARGTASAQNSQFLNGINVGDPAAIGAAGYYYDFDAFDDIQVSTGAHDITVPTSGVFLNMVTKAGGDQWDGRGTFTWTGDQLQGRNDHDPFLQKYGFRPDGNTTNVVSDVNLSAGGPLVAKKLRFFGSFRDWRVHVNTPVANSQTVLDQTNIDSGLANFTWQANSKNRITGFYSHQRYSKPNRLLNSAASTVPDSTVDEEDAFDVFQGLWNAVVTNNLFLDARGGVNKILFPTYFDGGNQQSLTDLATNIIYGNNPSEVIRHRNRYQANATAQYYIDQALGGRHELRFGFDYTHAVSQNETHRVDQVQTFYNSTVTPQAQTVNIYATPLIDIEAVNVAALYAQDSYSMKRLTLTGGVRWERLEGYLPAQSSPPSVYFPDIPRSFAEVRNLALWHTAGPRISGIVDLTGDGKTAAKASYGRYYYIIPTGGFLSTANPNSNYFATYKWNDANGDLKFQPGEQTGVASITSGTTTTVDSNLKRPYTDEFSAGFDRELMANFKFSAVFTYRREKNLQVTINPDNPYASTPTTAVDPGPDGIIGTADDSTYQFYQRLSPLNRSVITNDPTVVESYKGLELTVTKRLSNRWQMLAGYTRSVNRIDNVTLDASPNFLINANGLITADVGVTGSTRCGNCGSNNTDRPDQFKLTGMYILPWYDVIVSANLAVVSGPPATRQITRSLAFGAPQTINLEPLGSHRLDAEGKLDLRVGKLFRFNRHEFEATADFDNLTNANWIYAVRTLTPATTFTDPTTGARQTLAQFLAPTAILGPRTVVFRVSYKF